MGFFRFDYLDFEKPTEVTESNKYHAVDNKKTNEFKSEYFSLKYPKSWEKQEVDNESVKLVVLSPFVDEHTFRQNFNIIIKKDRRDYNEVWTASKKQLAQIAGYKLHYRKEYVIDGIEGKKTGYEGYLNDFLLHFTVYEIKIAETYITITFIADREKYNQQKGNMETIISTLKFLK